MGNRYDLGQGLGIVMLGAGLGLSLALVEQALRRAWVQVLRGRQEGRAYLLGLEDLGPRARRAGRGRPLRRPDRRPSARRDRRRRPRLSSSRSLAPPGRTKVNGEVVTGPRTLLDGDRIELGQTLLLFRRR